MYADLFFFALSWVMRAGLWMFLFIRFHKSFIIFIWPSWTWVHICFNPPRHWTQPPKPSACSTPLAWTSGHEEEVFPTTCCTQNHHETKKKTPKDVIQCLVPRGPVSVDFSAPASKFSWQILKSQHIADWQKRDAKIAASLRTKGGVTTSTSDVEQLTLHFAHDLPLWHICLTNMPQVLLLTSISVAKAKPHQGLSKLQRWKTLGTNLPILLLRDQFAQQTHPEVCHDHRSQFNSTSS